MVTLIKNSQIVTETKVFCGDILFDEKILAIGNNLSIEEGEVLEGYIVLAGGVDIHTHMTLDVGIAKVVDDFVSGGQAALCGGTTSIIDHVGFAPVDSPLSTSPHEYVEKNGDKAAIDFGLHGVFQHFHKNTLEEMKVLAEEGITSFKIYLTYDYRLQDEDIVEILQKTKEWGILPIFHAENHQMVTNLKESFVEKGNLSAQYHPLSRPAEAEALAIKHLVSLAKEAGNAPIYIAHLSSQLGLEEVIQGKKEGNPYIYAETCPQYLMLTDEVYDNPVEGLKYILSPPIHKKEDREALWQGLMDGHIQTIGTDHCPFHFYGAKQRGKDNFTLCPNGAPGVAERLPLLYVEAVEKRGMSLCDFSKLVSGNPAKFAGLYPEKGSLTVGSDSDLLLFSPDCKDIVQIDLLEGNADYSLYEGFPMQTVQRVYQRGKLVVEHGKCIGGSGGYLPRKKYVFG
ncbi:MAG: dihydropyrimidinase [Eubacteriales bacterium]